MRFHAGLMLVFFCCVSSAAAQTTGYLSMQPRTEPSATTGYLKPDIVLAGGPIVSEAPSVAEMQLDPTAARFWFRIEYLLWRIKQDRASVPFLTTGATGDLLPGALGQPNTAEIFDNTLDYPYHSGGRFSLGWWFDDDQMFGVEANGFSLESRTIHDESNSSFITGQPLAARPFFNTLTGQQNAMVITAPTNAAGIMYVGGIDIFADSRTWGAEINFWGTLLQEPDFRLRFLTGFRYLGQKDQIRIDQATTPVHSDAVTDTTLTFGGATFQAGNVLSVRDFYETLNHFYGGQVGAQGSWQRGRWVLDLTGKAGLGSTQQQLNTVGFTKLWIQRPGDPNAGQVMALPGGLYLLPGQIGQSHRGKFSFAGEADVRVSYLIGQRWRAQVGYTFLYWSSVVRPAEQIVANLDPRQIPSNPAYDPVAAGAASPVFRTSDFWAQGLTFGLEWKY